MMPDLISNFMLPEFEYGLPEPMETHALAVHDLVAPPGGSRLSSPG